MADSWSGLEVLQELDEANAAYFALTVNSKASLYKLVCTLCLRKTLACASRVQASPVRDRLRMYVCCM